MEISQRIIDYTIWYYCKYYPSQNKLKRKLFEKFGENSENGKKYGGIGEEEITYIFEEKMKNILQEEEVLESKIRVLLGRNKSRFYIQNNLRQKYFESDLINEKLEEYFIQGEGESIKLEFDKILRKQGVLLEDYSEADFSKKQKILQKLLAKGFKYDDVRNSLQEYL